MLKLGNTLVGLGALVVLTGSFAFANEETPQTPLNQSPLATPTPAPVSIPKIEKTIGSPITFTWDDGRQATVEMNTPINQLVPMPMELVENSCNSERQASCEYRAGISAAGFRLAWTKHSDPAKIGTPLKFTVKGSVIPPTLLLDVSFWTPINFLTNPGGFPQTPLDEISCPSWSWLGQGSIPPASITIPAISTEFMFINPNTGVDENRTIITATEIGWSRLGSRNDSIALQSIGSLSAVYSIGVEALFIGDVMKWTIEKSTNLYCDVGFKVNSQSSQSIYGEMSARALVDTAFKPFIFQGSIPFEDSPLGSILETNTTDLEKVVFE